MAARTAAGLGRGDDRNAETDTFGLLDPAAADRVWRTFLDGHVDQGFFAWQWISLGLTAEALASLPRPAAARTEGASS